MPFFAIGGDLSEPGVADHMVERGLDAYGQIDTLVNNAAALIRLRLIDFTEALMQKAVRWNVWNTLRCCKAVLPHMLERQYRRIVNIGASSISAAKPGGLARRFTRSLRGSAKARWLGSRSPSPAKSCAMASRSTASHRARSRPKPMAPATRCHRAFASPAGPTPSFFAEMARMAAGRVVGMGRPANPTEVAAAVAFFGSPEASFVTGQHLGASGGVAML
jgi:2,3-dihydroxy-2,3-dihydro-p-cumate dehydrogenase